MVDKLSIIVCSKDRHEELNLLIDVLHELTLAQQQAELIVVEDVSGCFPPVFEPNAKADIYIQMDKTNDGFGAIRQRGVEAASGDIIVFIDDDCMPCAGWLETLLLPFADQDVVAVGGGILPQDGGMVAQATALIGLPAGGLPRLLLSNKEPSCSDLLSTGNLALRRSAVLAAGGFDTRHRFGGEDQQLVAKLCGKKMFVAIALVKHRNRDSFLEVWRWFVRRGLSEYRVNRISGMGEIRSLLHPWRWSWSWRLVLVILVYLICGTLFVAALLISYYLALLIKTMLYNHSSSSVSLVEASRQACFRWPTLLLVPALRLWMDWAREYGRIVAFFRHS